MCQEMVWLMLLLALTLSPDESSRAVQRLDLDRQSVLAAYGIGVPAGRAAEYWGSVALSLRISGSRQRAVGQGGLEVVRRSLLSWI